MLEKLPEAIYSLPRLKKIDIGSNNFSKKEISAIRKRFKEIPAQKVKIEYDHQGYGQKEKKLRALNGLNEVDKKVYYNACLDAANESPLALQYVDLEKLGTRFKGKPDHYAYYKICEAAVKKSPLALKYVDLEKLNDNYRYFLLCKMAMEPENPPRDISSSFKAIKDEYLTDNEYIRVCLGAALHCDKGPYYFLSFINSKRLDRASYEHICFAAIVTNPLVFCKMENPSYDFCLFAAKLGTRLEDIPLDMRTYELCLAAVNQHNTQWNLQHVPAEHKTAELCMEAVRSYGGAIEYVPAELVTEEMCLIAVRQNGYYLSKVPEPNKTEAVCLEAARQDSRALEYMPEQFKAAAEAVNAEMRNKP